MRLDKFKKLVKLEFGKDLEHATPANVRDFIDETKDELLPEPIANRIVLNDPFISYEEVIRDFFVHVLDMPSEESIIALWTLSFHLAFGAIESRYEDTLAPLFQED